MRPTFDDGFDRARAALNRSDMEFSFRMYAGSPTEGMTAP
jgi:hypothetical protein